jgi:hypothetical protein
VRTIGLARVPGWRQLKAGFAECRRAARLHHEPMGLGERYMQDIGLNRAAAYHPRHSQPFWLRRPCG